MKKYKVIGYEHREGISKKNNKPYNIDILHCMHDDPISVESGYGNAVESFILNRTFMGEIPAMPLVGDVVGFYFNRFGAIEELVKF